MDIILCVTCCCCASLPDFVLRGVTILVECSLSFAHTRSLYTCALLTSPHSSHTFVSDIRLHVLLIFLKGTEAAEHVKNNARSKRLAKKSGKLTQDEAQAKATKAKKASAFRNKVRERARERERERDRER